VCYLDGTHDRNALLDHLEEMVAQGALVVQEHDQPIKDAVQLHHYLAESLAGDASWPTGAFDAAGSV
jgi:hypothetical protein